MTFETLTDYGNQTPTSPHALRKTIETIDTPYPILTIQIKKYPIIISLLEVLW